ncbi:DUF6285 domain-containing protein [Mycolicibacterium alvei]|uniref:DUF6285 domain-containing protein n=1 Tax=Mycolicibacterium alvei TaxID=67081 RepID=A0A6N4US13_9MYCO|nr:DUF6285 domain-containing protein [Mycolicibacterium alvei]MCV7001245.1 hypothetical protein [Mycolicibacterium alvei]BBX26695.1 hypothetical protein MALV_18200 [Mycolicibacterium alvei]
MSNLYGRPTAAELVAAVAEFLDTEVREHTAGPVSFHARVAANALRMVERELLASDTPATATASSAALTGIGFADEAALAAAIRAGELDDRAEDVTTCLRVLVRQRLAAAHPGYDKP